jgi:transposase
MPEARLQLADWLLAVACTHIARERTGVDWRPVVKLLEDHLTVLVVNAHHITAVPGRQTDLRDGDGMCALRCHGRRTGRFMPPRHSREWREWTRHRQSVVRDRAAVATRLQKRMASAHIMLGPVAPTVLGLAGRCVLQARADGEEEATHRAPLAQGKLRAQTAPLQQSLPGHLPPPPCVLRQAL